MAKEDIDTIYDPRFFYKRWKLAWRVAPVCDAIIMALHPTSVIDVGCAIGEFVEGFSKRGVFARGIEGAENAFPHLQVPKEWVTKVDLREPIRVPDSRYDLALCFEVAEHIEPEFARQFMENLTTLSDRVLISAAVPGQLGTHHVNCQPREYWIDLFLERNFVRREVIETVIKKEWEKRKVSHKREMSSYYGNLIYFEARK